MAGSDESSTYLRASAALQAATDAGSAAGIEPDGHVAAPNGERGVRVGPALPGTTSRRGRVYERTYATPSCDDRPDHGAPWRAVRAARDDFDLDVVLARGQDIGGQVHQRSSCTIESSVTRPPGRLGAVSAAGSAG